MHFTIVGNPENRRVTAFCETAQQLGYEHPRVLSYLSWLQEAVEEMQQQYTIVKIDSPGENEAVRQLLSGKTIAPAAIGYSCEWYAGYCKWLDDFKERMQQQPEVTLMNDPDHIKLQFDKPRCQQYLQDRGVAVPRRLPEIHSYESLLADMKTHGLKQVFIKTAHGSSASGVIAFRKSGERVQAVSSAELVMDEQGLQLYNSLRVRTYTSEKDIAALINRLTFENCFAEEWLPKATLNDRYFDLRVLTIDGKARHTVIRTSGHIITNLHLGNKRGDLQEFIKKIGTDQLERIHQLAEQTAACFPNSLYMGVDLLLTADLKRVYVLEVNAFGDLLPNLLDAGETCYEAEIKAMVRKLQPATVC